MHVTTPKKKNDNKLVIIVNPTRRLGHIQWPSRGGVHKDKRRQARNNQKVKFKKTEFYQGS